MKDLISELNRYMNNINNNDDYISIDDIEKPIKSRLKLFIESNNKKRYNSKKNSFLNAVRAKYDISGDISGDVSPDVLIFSQNYHEFYKLKFCYQELVDIKPDISFDLSFGNIIYDNNEFSRVRRTYAFLTSKKSLNRFNEYFAYMSDAYMRKVDLPFGKKVNQIDLKLYSNDILTQDIQNTLSLMIGSKDYELFSLGMNQLFTYDVVKYWADILRVLLNIDRHNFEDFIYSNDLSNTLAQYNYAIWLSYIRTFKMPDSYRFQNEDKIVNDIDLLSYVIRYKSSIILHTECFYI